jgi:hypothetical protein
MSKEFTQTGYLLKELPEATQRKIYDKWEFDYDLFTDNYADFLTMLGFHKPDLHYNVSFSQSDDACFSCDYFDYEKGFVAKVKREYGTGTLLDFAKRMHDIYKKTAYKMHGKVTAGRCRSVVDFDYRNDFDKVEDEFDSWLDDYSYYLLRELQNEILFQTSFESFTELCEANEYYFNENGGLL